MVLDPPILARLIRIQPIRINGTNVSAEFEMSGCSNISYNLKFKHTFPLPNRYNLNITASNAFNAIKYNFQYPVLIQPSGLVMNTPASITYGVPTNFTFYMTSGTNLILESKYNNFPLSFRYNESSLLGLITIPPWAYTDSGPFELIVIYDNPITNPKETKVTIWVHRTLAGLQVTPKKAAWNRSVSYKFDVILLSGSPIDFFIDWNDSSKDTLYVFNTSIPNKNVRFSSCDNLIVNV